jgi:hypothetical protein
MKQEAKFYKVENRAAQYAALAEHIRAMADDPYLTGHPEWLEIAAEAQRLK